MDMVCMNRGDEMKYRVVGMRLVNENFVLLELKPLEEIEGKMSSTDSTIDLYNMLLTMTNVIEGSKTYEILFALSEVRENDIEIGSVVELDLILLK